MPHSYDEEPDDLGAFDEFVNHHLDFEPPEKRRVPSPPFINDSDDDDEDDTLPFLPTRNGLSNGFVRPSSISGTGSTSRPSGTPFPTPSPFSVPGNLPRASTPTPTDGRWRTGFYRVKRDLEIYQTNALPPRIIIIPDASRRLNRSIKYIPNVQPGWSAIMLRSNRLIIGFIKNEDVTLYALLPPGARTDFKKLQFNKPTLDVLLFLLLVALITYVFARAGETLLYNPQEDVAQLETRILSLETQLQAQGVRLSPERVSDGR